MKVIYIADGNGAEIADSVRKIESAGHRVVYWVGAAQGDWESESCIFHRHTDARLGKAAPKLAANQYQPASKELLSKLLKTESLVASMLRGPLARMRPQQFRHAYYEMVRYWNGVLDQLTPDAVVFTIVPHHLYSYVIYSLAELKGIKTIMFEDTWVSDRALIYHDFFVGSKALQQKISENKDKQFTLSDLSSDLQSYYRAHIDESEASVPVYMQQQQGQQKNIARIIRYLRIIGDTFRKSTLLKIIAEHIRKRFGHNLQREYYQLEHQLDFSASYVYVPLNYQPERTTSPQGDVYVDQILMIETIAAALPEGWKVYVKEHPSQWWRDGINYSHARYEGYYKKIAEIKNVEFVPITTDSRKLIRQAKAVAVVTGNAGWEAILRSVPALVFGLPFYRDCPVVMRVESVASCAAAMKKIVDGYAVDHRQVINYLKALDESSVRCYVDNFDETNSELSKQTRLNNYANAILKELD